MLKHLRRWGILYIILLLLFYLIIGAVAPFMHYKKISADTRNSFDVEKFYSEKTGPDRAMLMETNMSAWTERIRLLNTAEDRIILSTFDMREGESTRDVLSVILHKAEEGVQVKILVDGVSGFLRMDRNKLFYALSSHPNVEIKIYNPVNVALPWRLMGRMHDKYVIVDNKAFILGGRNTFDYFIGDYETDGKSLDREVMIYNTAWEADEAKESSLYQVEAYFEGVWAKKECKLFHDDPALADKEAVKEQISALHERYEQIKQANPELFEAFDYEAATQPTNHVELVSNPTGLYCKEPNVFFELTELMKQARKRVLIHTPYAVCNDYMYDTLRDVCAAVPEVNVMINSVENGDNFVASSDYLRHKQDLLDTGVQIYEFDGGISYHGKSIVIDDDISVVGSYNMDLRSTYVDTELMLVIQSEAFTRTLLAEMDKLQQDCRKVIDKTHYEVPEHITVAEVPGWKRFAWKVVGFLLQPFRILI